MGETAIQCPALGTLPAFRSRYSASNVILPSYSGDGSPFAAAVIDFVREHPTRVILPGGDPTVAALLPHRDMLAALDCTLALAPNSALKIANDKARTLQIARDLGIDQPKSVPVDTMADLPRAIAELGFPFVLKPTVSWTGRSSERVVPIEVIDEAEAAAEAAQLLWAGAGVLAQEWARGRREGVTLFVTDDDVLASFSHVEHRTTPALGGASVVRESIAILPDTLDASVRLVKAIGLQGICEVEFRRDANNRPLLMEVNARPAGTMENAILSGIDFPLMIWRWATGLPVERVDSYRSGVRMRWVQGDLRWLRENYRRSGRPDSVSRIRSFWIFGTEFARTNYYDYLDWHDLGPFRAELFGVAANARRAVSSRLHSAKGTL
jgi:predicted ATP-grasp superfamily ATP-dependent carboligase